MGLGATNGQKTFNFGQQPFLHRPAALTDTTELQTQNLPAADIVDGREHFQAITGGGGSGVKVVAGTAGIAGDTPCGMRNAFNLLVLHVSNIGMFDQYLYLCIGD